MHVCVRLCACLLVNVRELVEVGGEGLALCGTHRPIAHQTPCPLWGFVSAQHSGSCLRCVP